MKKMSKILAASILLAVVLSCFGIFSAFAEDAATDNSAYVSTIYDMDSKKSITVKNVGDKYPNFPTMTKGEEDGQTTWNLSFEGATAATDANSQDFFSTISEGWTIRIRDDAGTDARTGGEKNTEFIVIDMDVATDTEFIEDVYFNCRLLKSGAAAYNKDMAASGNGAAQYFPAISRDEDGRICVSNANGSNTKPALFESDSKWTHVTIVYDFHSYETVSEETGEVVPAVANTAYAYIDGYYVGNINSFPTTTSVLYFMRFQTINDNTLDSFNESTKFANFTIKRFATGYNGPLADYGILASGTHLSEIPDLAYCVEGAPTTKLENVGGKIADIQRGDTTIEIYDIDDLNGDLLDGDVVTLYKELSAIKPYIAVKMVSKTTTVTDETTGETTEVTADVPANIVWKDADGNVIDPDSLTGEIRIPNVIDIPSDAHWAVIKPSELTAITGGAGYYEGSGTTALIQDPLWAAIAPSGEQEVILFNDYVGYGRANDDVEGSTSSSSSGNRVSSGSLTFDLNGYTFKNAAPRTHYINIYGSGVQIIFKNGGLVHAAGSNNLVMAGNYTAGRIIIENCDVDIKNGTIFDQRGGTLYYVDSDITTTSSLTNVKAIGNGGSGVFVMNCTVNSTASTLVNMAQTNSSGRCGSATVVANFYNSTIVSSGALVDGDIYANEAHDEPVYSQNLVNHYVNIRNCDVETTSNLTFSEVMSLPKDGEKPITARVDLNISDSRIKAAALSYVMKGSTDTAKVDYLQTIDVESSKLILAKSLTVGRDSDKLPADVVINIGAGCLSHGIPAGGTVLNPTVNLPEGYVWAYTSLDEECTAIVTNSYTEPYTYKLGAQDAVEFVWNKAEDGSDVVDINKVVTLASEAGAYKYSWNQDGNAFTTVLESEFALDAKLNLTLYSDLALNLYIPKAEYDSKTFGYAVTDARGNALTAETVYVDGTAYYKFVSAGIAPAEAEKKVINVNVTVNGAYGDSFTENAAYAVIDYLGAYAPSENEKENALIDAIINYIYNAYLYVGKDAANIAAILPETEYTIDTTDAALGALAGVEVAVRYGDHLAWLIKAEPATSLNVTYAKLGALVTENVVVPEDGIVVLAITPADFAAGITVAKDGIGAFVNLAGYYAALTDEPAKAMVVAIYNYAKAAEAYRAIEDAAAEAASGELLDGTLTFKYKSFTSAGLAFLLSGFGEATDVVFENCVFVDETTALVVGGKYCDAVKSITFKGCTFIVGGGTYALNLVGNDVAATDFIIEDCFFNSDRGINISGNNASDYKSFVYGDIVIKGNTFINKLADKPAIQVAGDVEGAAALVIASIVIEDNEFKCGPAVRAHETLTAEAAEMNITFANNTVSEGVATVVGDGTDLSDTIAAAWAAKFN